MVVMIEDETRTGKAPHIAVIGGGITGLSAAWQVQQSGDVRYTLLEQSGRWGGKIQTETLDLADVGRFVIEHGPDSVATTKPYAHQLADALGLETVGSNLEQRRIYLYDRERLTPLPDGMMLIIPTRFAPFALSPLISIPGKMRMALEPFIPAKDDGQDESLDTFVRRRLGREAVDKLAEPLLSGIFNTDPEQQSVLATFPRFRTMEEKYGSLTQAILQAKAKKRGKAGKVNPFATFPAGMESLVDTVVGELTGDLRLNTGVDAVCRDCDGSYRLFLEDGSTLYADGVIFATPAAVTSRLLWLLAPKAVEIINAIPYTTTGTVTLAYPVDALSRPLDGHGVVIPRKAERRINAITWSSSKFAGRAPAGYALMRVFFGGSRSPQTAQLDDAAVLDVVRDELHTIMGVTAEPLFTRTSRWPQAIPQYVVGHGDKMDALDKLLPDGVQLAGSAYRGASVPDCIRSGRTAADKALAAVGQVVKA